MKNEKLGKIILNSKVYYIRFNKNPSIELEEKENEDGTKQLTGKQKWNPIKFKIINPSEDGLVNMKYSKIFLLPRNELYLFELIDCVIDLEKNEIIFDYCVLYEE